MFDIFTKLLNLLFAVPGNKLRLVQMKDMRYFALVPVYKKILANHRKTK